MVKAVPGAAVIGASIKRWVAAAGLTVVLVVLLLFAVFGSNSLAKTVVTLKMGPATVGRITTLTVVLVPAARSPRANVNVLSVWLKLWFDDACVTPAGSLSVSVTPVAARGPLLVTVIW